MTLNSAIAQLNGCKQTKSTYEGYVALLEKKREEYSQKLNFYGWEEMFQGIYSFQDKYVPSFGTAKWEGKRAREYRGKISTLETDVSYLKITHNNFITSIDDKIQEYKKIKAKEGQLSFEFNDEKKKLVRFCHLYA